MASSVAWFGTRHAHILKFTPRDCQSRAQTLCQLGQVIRRRTLIAGVRRGKATVLRFEDVRRIRVAIGRQQCPEDSSARRLARQHALAHAAVVGEHQAGGLLTGVAERVDALIGG